MIMILWHGPIYVTLVFIALDVIEKYIGGFWIRFYHISPLFQHLLLVVISKEQTHQISSSQPRNSNGTNSQYNREVNSE
jgi:hypothetical protein